ncbi:MAG TPA: hypothetical protein VHO03_16580 [Ignavibacteriales bacterium]|nr:hypothetical protein [Ignavibacteriales bacterium]
MLDLVLTFLVVFLLSWIEGKNVTWVNVGVTVIVWFLFEIVTLLDALVKAIKDKKANIIYSDNVTLMNTKEEEA